MYDRDVARNSSGRRRDAERNVERILDAAIDALSERSDTGMGEIALRAGVGRATLYRHFSSRAALTEAIRERAMREAEGAVRESRPEEGPASEALVRLIVALSGVIERYRVLTQAPHEHEDEGSDRIKAQAIAVIERGQRDGEFTTEMPADLIAEMLKGMMMSACACEQPIAAGALVAQVLVRGVHPAQGV